MDIIHIERSCITVNNINKAPMFVEKLNKIPNFLKFFDKWGNNKLEQGMGYELTYHGVLSCELIEELIKNIIELCKEYECVVEFTIKIFDDGEFLLYWIITENTIHDVTYDINQSMRQIENKILGPIA
jgi:hypothetical protein